MCVCVHYYGKYCIVNCNWSLWWIVWEIILAFFFSFKYIQLTKGHFKSWSSDYSTCDLLMSWLPAEMTEVARNRTHPLTQPYSCPPPVGPGAQENLGHLQGSCWRKLTFSVCPCRWHSQWDCVIESAAGKVKVGTQLLSIDISLVVIYQTALVVWFS